MHITVTVLLSVSSCLFLLETSNGELEKIEQLPATTLAKFYAYRHVSIIHFNVPLNAANATWRFRAKEVKTGGIFPCLAQNVTVHLKPGSIPLVNPDESKLPANLLQARRAHYTLLFKSDGNQTTQNISAPLPGDWFAIAFRSWSDPNNGKIMQQGISASCETILEAELYIERGNSLTSVTSDIVQPDIYLNDSGNSVTLRFLFPEDQATSAIMIKSSSGESAEVEVNVTAGSYISTSGLQVARGIVNSTMKMIPFRIWANAVHYVTIRLLSGNSSDVSVILDNKPSALANPNITKLVRKSYPDFFLFDYEHLAENGTKSLAVNLTANNTSIFSFEVNPISDIGGTLTVAIRLENKGETVPDNFVVVGCLHLGTFENISSETGNCSTGFNDSHLPVLKASKSSPGPVYVHVPFPDPGVWYLSLRSFINPTNCSCLNACRENCDSCPCMKPTSGSVEMSVASSPCIEGNCGTHGRCVHYMSGGFVFSACYCFNDYRGLDCSDAKYVPNNSTVLLGLLTLTFSNMVFIGSIYFALRRRYFLEALVYASVLFFSTFYHACESGEDIYNFCIMRVSVLQFCDFFSALLAFWVTLVAMAGVSSQLTAIFDLGGAIFLAMCAELNRTALWVFMTPAITGSFLVILLWARQCRARRTIHYPAKRYQYYYLPAGLGLVVLGLICYAFLQTQKNYSIVHSLWHMVVAGGVMFLLPNRGRPLSEKVARGASNEISFLICYTLLAILRVAVIFSLNSIFYRDKLFAKE